MFRRGLNAFMAWAQAEAGLTVTPPPVREAEAVGAELWAMSSEEHGPGHLPWPLLFFLIAQSSQPCYSPAYCRSSIRYVPATSSRHASVRVPSGAVVRLGLRASRRGSRFWMP